MKLRFKFPFHGSVESLGELLQTAPGNFVHDNLSCEVALETTLPAVAAPIKALPQEQTYRFFDKLSVTVDAPPSVSWATDPAAQDSKVAIFETIVSIIDRLLFCIRNYARDPKAAQIHNYPGSIDLYLREWNAETSPDGKTWTPLVVEVTIHLFAESLVLRKGPFHVWKATDWRDVTEALEDGLNPGPEEEFFINALQHLSDGNLRLAVIESAIGLEIVTSQFLSQYLVQVKRLTPKDAHNKLNGVRSIKTRLQLLLDLALEPDELSAVSIQDVFGSLSLRNKIIHETGNLPQSATPATVHKGVQATWHLAFVLARKRDALQYANELRLLEADLAKGWEHARPRIRRMSRHQRDVAVAVNPYSPIPTSDQMNKMVSDCITLMAANDVRFRPVEHLRVSFAAGMPGKEVHHLWSQGSLKPA